MKSQQAELQSKMKEFEKIQADYEEVSRLTAVYHIISCCHGIETEES